MRDLRRYARSTNFRLVGGFLVLLILVGDGLIYLIYGPSAAVSGLMCIFAGLIPVALITLVLALVGAIVKKVNDE